MSRVSLVRLTSSRIFYMPLVSHRCQNFNTMAHWLQSEQRPNLAHEPAHEGRCCHRGACAGFVVCDDEVIAGSLQADSIKINSLCLHGSNFAPAFLMASN